MTTLIFVRHGQSDGNLKKIFTGQLDLSLTDLGREQAQRTAQYLCDNYSIDAIYSSDLKRSMDTAAATAQKLSLEIIPEVGLREYFVGDWQGVYFADIPIQFPTDHWAWRNDFAAFHPSGGESADEFSQRIFQTVDRIVSENEGKCVAIFTHATPIRLMRGRVEGLPMGDTHRIPSGPNAAISVIEFDEDRKPRLVLYGYAKHQEEQSNITPPNLA
jgi:probable phosphoglycerate mutase